MKEWFAYIPLVLLLAVLLGYLGYLAWRSWKKLDELKLKDRFAARNEFIKTTAQILGGAFFLFGLYFTWANVVATQEKNVTDLYVKAIEQLGSEKMEVCLGGIYALERIARDSKKDHWTIMEVLTTYVRDQVPAPAASEATPAQEPPPGSRKEVPTEPGKPTIEDKPKLKPKADIQAILTVLGRTAIPFATKGEKRRLDLQATNLAGAYLREANLQWAKLSDANLQQADLMDANLQGAWLPSANLQRAWLWKANLQGARLWKANLQGADLRGPEGFNMGAIGLTAEEVAKAFWDETTNWPEGFTPPPKRKEEKKEGE